MSVKIPEEIVEMIVEFEVGNKKYYESKCKSPIWPGGSSGVTIGIGYDLAHVTR